jgi:hypothetical protein
MAQYITGAKLPAIHDLYTVVCENIHPPFGIFPILLTYNLELKYIFWGVVSFDLHNMPTTFNQL